MLYFNNFIFEIFSTNDRCESIRNSRRERKSSGLPNTRLAHWAKKDGVTPSFSTVSWNGKAVLHTIPRKRSAKARDVQKLYSNYNAPIKKL